MTNKTREFDKSFLQETIFGNTDAEIVEDEIIDHSRWSVHHYLVFQFEGKHYGLPYSRGATEMQDESPLEYEPDRIAVVEVEPVEIVKRDWRPVPAPEVEP